MSKEKTYCGVVTIVGRQNVGKSTLLNKLIGHKVSITSCKRHTTNQFIRGIKTEGNYQTIYVDTPGFYINQIYKKNFLMNLVKISSINNIELIIFVVEGTYWTIDDDIVINTLRSLPYLVLLVINKIDNLLDKTNLLPHIKFLSNQMNFLDIVPVSAKKGIGIDIINKIVKKHMSESAHYFPKHYITDCSQRFMVSEIIREKLMRFLGDELPYSIIVKIKQFTLNKQNSYDIYSQLLVNRNSQKKIIIGNKGSKIKKISIEARMSIENFFSMHVNLKLWVKVQNRFSHDICTSSSLEYIK